MSSEQRLPNHQLQELELDDDALDAEPSSAFSSLPPADGGKAAWLFLLGCFVIEMLLWGEVWPIYLSLISPRICRISFLIRRHARLLHQQ